VLGARRAEKSFVYFGARLFYVRPANELGCRLGTEKH